MPSVEKLEKLVQLLLPPACREHILGDLRETLTMPSRYVIGAIAVLPPVIISRIRRTTDAQVLLMEAFAVYSSFAAAAWYLGNMAFLYGHAGFARLAIPTAIAVTCLLLSNAYADPEKRSPMTPMLQSLVSVSGAFLGQAAIFDTRPGLAVPFGIMLWGSCVSLVLVSSLRMLFPPLPGQPKFVAVDLRRSEPPRPAAKESVLQNVRQRSIGKPRSSQGLTILIASVAAVLVADVLIFPRTPAAAFRHLVIAFALAVAVIYQIRTKE
jgi:hypothetical protein